MQAIVLEIHCKAARPVGGVVMLKFKKKGGGRERERDSHSSDTWRDPSEMCCT